MKFGRLDSFCCCYCLSLGCLDQSKRFAKVRYKLRNDGKLSKKPPTLRWPLNLRQVPRSRARCLLPLARRRHCYGVRPRMAACGWQTPGSSRGRTPSSRDTSSRQPVPLHAPLDSPVRLADAAFKPSAAPTTPAQRPIIPAVCPPPPSPHGYHPTPHTSRTQVSLHPSVKRYYIRQPSCSQPTDHMLMHSEAASLEI